MAGACAAHALWALFSKSSNSGVEIENDGVTARLEGYDEEVMKEKLNILGYLLIHTRQLDMIMFNDASCLQLKSKMLVDISSVVLSKSSSVAVLN